MTAPSELRVARDRRSLAIAFPDGRAFTFPAEYLRIASPSAEVQGHGPGERKLVPGKRAVEIIAVVPIGNYAVRIGFDDLHDTGIYSWRWFAEHGADFEARWQAYLDALEAAGLSRER